MFKIGDVLTLSDDKKYVVVETLNYNSKIYLYMIEENNWENFGFGMLIDDSIKFETNMQIIGDLFAKVNEKMKNKKDSE